jgi:hypothetical protein
MKKLLPVLTLAALAAIPGNASAAQFGGGAIVGPPAGDSGRGVVEQVWFKTPRSLPGRMNVSMEVDNLRCEDPAFGAPAGAPVTTGVNRFEKVKVARDGSFSATLVLDQTAPTGERSKGRSTLKGKVSGRRAKGTISSFLNVSDENGNRKTRCELARTRWVASAARVSRKRVTRPDGRRYFGVNDTRSSGTRLNAVVNLNRARKKGAIVIGYNARCTEDPENPIFGGADYSPVFRIRDGKFSSAETYSFGDPDGAGFAGRINARYTGAFVQGGVKGRLRIRVTLFQDGQEIDRCDTGKVKWRASQP